MSILFILLSLLGWWWILSHGSHTNPAPSSEHTSSGSDAETPSAYDQLIEEQSAPIRKEADTYNEAIKRRDISLCEQIESSEKQAACKDQVILIQANSSTDLSICDAISENTLQSECRDTIAEGIARNTKNKHLCARIENERIKTRCREDIDSINLRGILQENRASQATCEELEGNFRSECMRAISSTQNEEYYLQAMKILDISLCAHITEKALATTCRDAIFLEQAQKNGNAVLCTNITDGEKKVHCIEKTKAYQDIHTFKRATESKNLTECEKISDTHLKHQCHNNITLELVKTSKNTKLCDTLTNTGIIENCKRIENQ